MTTTPYVLDIPFKGARSGAFPLTWGQHWVWESIVARAPYYSDLSGSHVVAVPDGCDLSAVADALAALLDRYETFRTKFSLTPDDVPQQVILAEGHLRAEVRDADDAEEAAATAVRDFNDQPFTLPELSLRAAVITSDGNPAFVVLCTFHMAIDCHGMVPVLEHFESLLHGRPDCPGELTHPADRALEEQSAKGVERSARGVRYWKEELARFPDDPLPYAGHRPESPRYRTYRMHSEVVRAVSQGLAAELGVSTAAVILAMAAVRLAGRSGSRTCGIVLAANHRYDLEAMCYPGTLVQGVPAALPVADVPPHKLISRCYRAGMLAALVGHCHPGDLAETLRESYDARAAGAKLACVVNLDVPEGPDAQEPAGLTRAEAERLLTRSRYERAGGTPVQNERFYLAAHGNATDFHLSLRADTAVLTSAEIVEFLRDLERALIDCLPDEGAS